MTRLPNGSRFVKQEGYRRGHFHNWCIFSKDGTIISLGGKTKKHARELGLSLIQSRIDLGLINN